MRDIFQLDLRKITLGALALSLLVAAPVAHADEETFFQSDDYEEGEEIKNVFLKDAEYRIMIEDLERNGQEFDWGWALTPGWQGADAAPVEEPQPKRRFGRGGGGGASNLVQEPKQLGFDITSYGTISISDVENFSGLMSPDELAAVRQAFALGFEQLGLQVVGAGAPADLDLDLALVDINREGGGFGWVQIEPFIEIELRLRDTANDGDLLLIRNQEHGEDAEAAALQYANQLVIFLR